MPATEVKLEYEEMGQVRSMTEEQRERTQKLFETLEQQLEVLKGGEWIGDNADKFYAEMDDDILPAVHRLIGAFDQMDDVIGQITNIFQTAEDEATACFPNT